MKHETPEHLVYVAQIIAKQVAREIEALGFDQAEYRRDFDGVSQTDYLLQKLVGELLSGYPAHRDGLVLCNNELTKARGEM